jgi:hypothetical protein
MAMRRSMIVSKNQFRVVLLEDTKERAFLYKRVSPLVITMDIL